MKKVAVLFAEGFEEIEALTIVDVLRRAEIPCSMIGVESLQVTGSHQITVQMDGILDNSIKTMDMVVLPGGMPGAKNLKENQKVLQTIQYFDKYNKWIGAICAAPIVLQAAGILKDVKVTSYPGYEQELVDAKNIEKLVQVDAHIITSRGPATTLAFVYEIIEQLGYDSSKVQEGMLYNQLMRNI